MPRFIRKPQTLSVREGQTANFSCKVMAVSPPVITWHKDDHTLTQSGKHMQKYQGNRYDLRISRVKIEQDKGEYIVRAVNSYGKVEEQFFLKIEEADAQYRRAVSVEPIQRSWRRKIKDYEFEEYKAPGDKKPEFVFPLRNRFIQEGDGVKLLASVEGKPKPHVQWFKDGKELRPSTHYDIHHSLGICSLEIISCEPGDAGRYSCLASNSIGEEETSCKVDIAGKTYSRPQGFVASSFGSTSSYSRSSRRTERTEDVTDNGYTRTRRVTEIKSSSSRYSSDKAAVPPVFIENLTAQKLEEGDTLTFICKVTGTPDPDIEWYMDGRMLSVSDGFRMTYYDGTCKLSKGMISVEDAGNYRCSATNVNGTVSTSCKLEVRSSSGDR